MKQNWLTEIYTRIKESRDRELDHILALLRPKATSDLEIAESVRILERWRTGKMGFDADVRLDPPDEQEKS